MKLKKKQVLETRKILVTLEANDWRRLDAVLPKLDEAGLANDLSDRTAAMFRIWIATAEEAVGPALSGKRSTT